MVVLDDRSSDYPVRVMEAWAEAGEDQVRAWQLGG